MNKPLQSWYIQLNGIYLDRNFYRSTESLALHLVEVSRGLAAAANVRRKRELASREFLPKAVAWWLTLCGRAGIPNIEDVLWAKFPRCCPYCGLEEHKGRYCKEQDPAKKHIDWRALAERGDSLKKPASLAEWQRVFNDIYPRDDSTDHETNVYRLQEELGEIAEAVRTLPVAPQYFISEAPDVFAWLMGFANQFDFDKRTDLTNYGDELERDMLAQYPGFCVKCGREVCKCPPIHPDTLGRVADEAPVGEMKIERLFSLQESIHLFKKGQEIVEVGGERITVTKPELQSVREDIDVILSSLNSYAPFAPTIMVSLAATLGSMKRLAETGDVTQQAVDEIMDVVQSVPSENRANFRAFLSDIANSETFQRLFSDH